MKLTDKHLLMMREMVLEGKTQSEISEEYDITTSRLSLLVNEESWKKVQLQMRSEVFTATRIRIEGLMGKAVSVLKEGMNEEDPRIKLNSAVQVLDRGGIRGGTEVVNTVSTITPKEMVESYQAAIKRKLAALEEIGMSESDFDRVVISEGVKTESENEETEDD